MPTARVSSNEAEDRWAASMHKIECLMTLLFLSSAPSKTPLPIDRLGAP